MSTLKSIQNLMFDGDFKQALRQLNSHIKENKLSDKNKLAFLLAKCRILNSLGEYEEAIKLSQDVQKRCIKQKDDLCEIDSLLEEIFGNYRLNRMESALSLIEKADDLISKYKKSNINERKAQLLVNKIYVYTANSEFAQAYSFAQQNYDLCRNLKDVSHLARAYHTLGWVHGENGELDLAIDNFERSLELREKIGNQLSLSYTMFILGYTWLQKGELYKAEGFISRSLKLRKKIGNQQDIAWTLNNLGDISLGKGDTKEAQDYYEKALQIFQTENYNVGIIFSLMRLCLIFEDLDNPQLVKDTLEKALYYAHEVENIDPEVYVLFDLIHFTTKRKLGLEDLQNYLERLNEINTQYPSKLFNQVYRLARALVLKSTGTLRDRKKAHVLLQQISEEEIVNYQFTRIAMINYSEILALELKSHLGDDHLINELSELSYAISPIQFQQSYSLIAESFIYQSKSALAEIDILKARELLRRAQYLNDFLELYKKGPTPFRIMFTLFIKERSLGELSELLNLTKGALTSQIKLLTSLDLVKVSRERQVRSATMLKKYYSIGPKAEELIKPFRIKIIENLDSKDEHITIQFISTMIPRLMVKMIQDTMMYIDRYQHLLEEHVIARSIETETSSRKESKKIELIKSFFDKDDEIRINQLFLTESQYKTYSKLLKEFNKKVEDQILNEKQTSNTKSRYITHITMPIKELMMLERLQNKKSKD